METYTRQEMDETETTQQMDETETRQQMGQPGLSLTSSQVGTGHQTERHHQFRIRATEAYTNNMLIKMLDQNRKRKRVE